MSVALGQRSLLATFNEDRREISVKQPVQTVVLNHGNRMHGCLTVTTAGTGDGSRPTARPAEIDDFSGIDRDRKRATPHSVAWSPTLRRVGPKSWPNADWESVEIFAARAQSMRYSWGSRELRRDGATDSHEEGARPTGRANEFPCLKQRA